MDKILTLENLYSFFVEQNKTVNFSSKESGKPIVIKTNGLFEAVENDMPEMLKLKLKVCHTKTNRNGSHISNENMEKAMPTLKYRPILAYIHDTPSGEKDFYAHNMEIIENEDGETEINYLEKQVGCFTAEEPWLEYDEKMDKDYVMAYAVIPEGYTETADIIRRKGGTKVSCELIVNELSYNAKEKYLELTDFIFGGCTLLGQDEDGREIGEGMLGSRADITDFCHKEPIFNFQDKLIKTLEKLNFNLENFNKDFEQKGGEKIMNKFEELLKQYNVTTEDVTFETEGLSDEELESKFAEVFGGDNEEEPIGEGESTATNDGEEGAEGEIDAGEGEPEEGVASEDGNEPVATETEACGGKKKKKYDIDENGDTTISFEISHEDIRGALFQLLATYEEEDNEWYWVTNVYDDYFIFENWSGDKLYKQSYSVDGDNVSLDGDRQIMFKMILTESEKLAIDKMREDYAALETKYNELKTFKNNYDAAELKAKKDAIFARAEYSVLNDDEAFKALIADAEKYSVDECENKADVIFAKYCKAHGEFAVKDEKKSHIIGINFDADDGKSDAYGGLFKEYKKKHNK